LDIGEIINRGIEELELTDTFLVEVKVKGRKIEVFVDSDEGINLQKCQRLSRWIEATLDENKMFGEEYTLEVSSPGVGTPLKLQRQYPKNIGKIIEVKYGDDDQVRGILTKVGPESIEVSYETKVKEGKKTKKVMEQKEIKFEDIIESRIKISFN
jgi:ribosome maturation factor RimP